MSKQRRYSEETKAAAMAALLTGQSVSSVAREYKIPKGTVSNWRRQAQKGVQADRTQNTHAREDSRERIGTLLIEYLEETLRSLRIQAQVFGDTDWLNQQDASQLAVLHGVQTDKAVRLLEALGANPEDDGDAA